MCLLACGSAVALAQEPGEADLFAKQRILTAIGPGLRAVRQGPDGRLRPGFAIAGAGGC